ncbi:MAG: tyrosine-type recombinase/integrase [Desulfosudis oleivorans]|nr:tyrosine-type recombinase/integrase [Desulfosudis oleivorans]
MFLVRDVLRQECGNLGGAIRAKQGNKLPVILSIEEVKLFRHLSGKNLAFAQLLYGSGLRLMEGARLRVKDIDFDANAIFVRGGKG